MLGPKDACAQVYAHVLVYVCEAYRYKINEHNYYVHYNNKNEKAFKNEQRNRDAAAKK